jgi:pathogenesis-related protein 1
MRKALIVSGLALVSPLLITLAGCGNGTTGTGGSGGSGGSASDGTTHAATTGNATTGNASTGNASTGNASTGNASTGNASTGNASTGNASTGNASTGNVGSTSVASTTTGGGDMEPANMTGMTAAHNAARAAVVPAANPSIPPLSWSSTVATFAQTYSENCVFAHSGGPYGENIYATSGTASPQAVVTSWVSEDANYNYANNTCSGVCGHYTQVVWRDTTSLGCGVTNCTTNSPFGGGNWQFWVCDYDPPGNFNNMKPY